MFIALEGIDGSGKSSQARFVVQWLAEHGFEKNTVLTYEPTREGYGAQLREVLEGRAPFPENPLSFQELYVRDRKDHLEGCILPHLEKCDIVISDRYFLSTLAYGMAGGVSYDALMDLHKTIIGEKFIMPDITFLIDIDPRVAQERIQKRSGGTLEHFEKKADFLHAAAKHYRELAMKFPNMHIISGDRSQEEVSEEIGKILSFHPYLCTKQS
ncbi:dTMP kinase [Candidatus Azambacteria bacterium RBG_16_47_10]|uniref:Thymidylate kinase n=1 Tax=Candidatus Azambacteria bacterium RBG_16_47_10 TaxID=1797292 RepID=A0A1F5B0B4_9BACT|nr:MAG: dTMP kinase [Candidatus Azambacteria bacterium RBG_16_47_10]